MCSVQLDTANSFLDFVLKQSRSDLGSASKRNGDGIGTGSVLVSFICRSLNEYGLALRVVHITYIRHQVLALGPIALNLELLSQEQTDAGSLIVRLTTDCKERLSGQSQQQLLMLRKRKTAIPVPLKVQLTPDADFLATQTLANKIHHDDAKGSLNEQTSQNKMFLETLIRFSAPDKPLPASFAKQGAEKILKGLNTRIGSIAFSREVLEDYEKRFQAMKLFFQKVIKLGTTLPEEELLVWRMLFLNNMSIIAFNNKDYSTAFDMLKEVLSEHRKNIVVHPVFTIAITNLSAIYHKMGSKAKCFEFLEMAFEYCKKLVDELLQKDSGQNHKVRLRSVLAIQCIMMMKGNQPLQGPNQDSNEIQSLMLRLVKEVKEASSHYLDIPFVSQYLEEKKMRQVQEVKTHRTSIRRPYNLKSLSGSMAPSDFDGDEADSPAKRYSYHVMKKEVDQLNQKYLHLEAQNVFIQSSLKELILIVRGKQTQSTPGTDQISLLNNIELTLEKSNMVSSCVFKTLLINIQFYDQGIRLKTFNGDQEKLSWGELFNIFKLLKFFHIYFDVLELNPTRHSIAWLLSKYINIESGITIRKQPSPILEFSHEGSPYGLFHIKDRRFSIYGQNMRALTYQMCEKSFNFYFSVLKLDEYQVASFSYFDEQPQRRGKQHYLEVIKLNDGANFEQGISQILSNMKIILRLPRSSQDCFTKVRIWFDETTNSESFLGVYYRLSLNSQESRLDIKMHPLNSYAGVDITQFTTKYHRFQDLSAKYCCQDIASLSKTYQLMLYNCLVDLTTIKVRPFKAQGKMKYIIQPMDISPEFVYFQQRMVLKKYYRPLLISVMRSANKMMSIRASYFNESLTVASSFTVSLNNNISGFLQNNPQEMRKKFAQIKTLLRTQTILKHFNRMDQNPAQKEIMHIQQLINMVEGDVRVEGERH